MQACYVIAIQLDDFYGEMQDDVDLSFAATAAAVAAAAAAAEDGWQLAQ